MRLIKHFKPVNYYATAVNISVIISIFALVGFHKSLTPELPLWYSFSWGEARLANPNFLWILPALVFCFFLMSYVLSKTLSKNHPILAEILVWTNTFLSFIFLVSAYKIILLGS